MIVRLRDGLLVATPEAGEVESLAAWLAASLVYVRRAKLRSTARSLATRRRAT